MTKIISSLFSSGGTPTTGLSPSIRIWEIATLGDTLLITDDPMSEVGDGFYKYEFAAYNPRKEYLFRTDGGGGLPASERFQKASNKNSAKEVWAADTATNNITDSFGEAINDMNLNVSTALSVLDILLKFQANRTKVDINANTLTIYDDDGVTPIHIFDLFDETGASSSDCVYERRPV